MEKLIRRSIVSGKVGAPASLPAAHRALVAAMLGPGQSVISNLPSTPHIATTIAACTAFGADIVTEGAVADIFGAENFSPPASLDCSDSNTTLKLFMPMAALFDSQVVFTGAGKLLEAQLAPYGAYLDRLGVFTESDSSTLPLKLHGPITETDLVYLSNLGTQFHSGLLFSLPLLEDDSEIGVEGSFPSNEYAEMTLDLMKRCQIELEFLDSGNVSITGGQMYMPLGSYSVPCSAYHSSYLALAGALCGKVTVEGNAAYSPIETLLSSFGASAKQSEGKLAVSTDLLEAVELSAPELGRLLPHALVMACLADGKTKIANISPLRRRMNNSMRLLIQKLSNMGARISEAEDCLSIVGGKLSGAEVEPEGDAAVAMACSVAGLAAQGQTRILGADCVMQSYPGFFKDLASIGAIIR